MDRTLLAELADRFLSGTATEQEKALLHQWFDTTTTGKDREEIELVFLSQKETEDEVKARMLTQLQTAIAQEPVEEPRRIIGVGRWIAAASILAAVGITGIVYWKAHKVSTVVVAANPVAEGHKDLLPGGNKASLLLGDGSVVNLGAVQNGVIKKVAGAIIDKHDGQLVYKALTVNAVAEMNTIRTPRGGQYEVILPDGTKVWLDAASELSYPTAFTGDNRQVQLKGEAYFEVAENKNKPFAVLVGEMKINVLGTHFNVMAYDDENAIKTTLLEGGVKVTMGQVSHLLQPGEQASLDRSTGVMKVFDVDVDETVAWKNGVFELGGAQIESVMRQMSRWYDVDVEYQGTTDQHFRGSIPRSVNASEVIKMLELTGAVHFSVEGKKIIVRP